MDSNATETASQSGRPDDSAESACCAEIPEVEEDALVADVQLLSALGNDTRYELVRRIGAAEGSVCVCDLEAAVGISQSGVSQALSRLYSAGLVTRRKEGSWRYYGLTDDAEQILETLDALGDDDE
ncbi:transcriptional regulator, ArsR family [Halomicrobium zhouii]|uniref:Transcriptional regulator, ArsR family n=1 Tax=Halomicrobium zhouii TaxID=767519 RepID=A0A1I6KI29_9EURY|nr:metalloregulator ArsR/SmtB family transcription factor [Halomicrobium zhouii]SFR90895.1 transcriptional regulator, ArsR family [Halomicrobium zhouii]